jgi:hypothetical protein
MEEKLIEFETSQLAKKKGLKEAYNYYLKDGKMMTDEHYKQSHHKSALKILFPAPTQSLLQKWLREKYNIDIDVVRDSEVHFKN